MSLTFDLWPWPLSRSRYCHCTSLYQIIYHWQLALDRKTVQSWRGWAMFGTDIIAYHWFISARKAKFDNGHLNLRLERYSLWWNGGVSSQIFYSHCTCTTGIRAHKISSNFKENSIYNRNFKNCIMGQAYLTYLGWPFKIELYSTWFAYQGT